jgi:hypothetical protein
VLFEREIGDRAGIVAVIQALLSESCPGASSLAGASSLSGELSLAGEANLASELSLGCHEAIAPR